MNDSPNVKQMVARFARECDKTCRNTLLRGGEFIHISCTTMLALTQERIFNAPVRTGERHAKRTARAKTPSGRDRQCSAYCADCDRRRTRDNIEATSQAQERVGRRKGASREHDRSPARGNRAQGRKREVGVMPGHRPEAVANAFLRKPGALGRLTQMQIQKLVYIAHGWMLGLSGEPLVDREPEAWERGPVFPDLREHIKNAGSRPLNSLIHENDDNPFAMFAGGNRGAEFNAELTTYEQQIIDHVWGRYGSMGAFRLSDLTHLPNTPWSEVYAGGVGRNDPIPNEIISRHYQELASRSQSA